MDSYETFKPFRHSNRYWVHKTHIFKPLRHHDQLIQDGNERVKLKFLARNTSNEGRQGRIY
jgi:hypothetical protein